MKKETKTATQTAVPEKPAAPERVHGLDLISKYRGAIMGFAALWILFFHEWVTLFVNNQVGVNIEGYLKRIGFCGVDIFLLLSGIGLTFAIRKGQCPHLLLSPHQAHSAAVSGHGDHPMRPGEMAHHRVLEKYLRH